MENQVLTIEQRKQKLFSNIIDLLDRTNNNHNTVKGFNKLLKIVLSVTNNNSKLSNETIYLYCDYKDNIINRIELINNLVTFADNLEKSLKLAKLNQQKHNFV